MLALFYILVFKSSQFCTQSAFTFSKITMETRELGVKYVQS